VLDAPFVCDGDSKRTVDTGGTVAGNGAGRERQIPTISLVLNVRDWFVEWPRRR
jgi:hypothetical protein